MKLTDINSNENIIRLLEDSSPGLAVIGREGTMLHASDTLCRLLEKAPEKILNRPAESLFDFSSYLPWQVKEKDKEGPWQEVKGRTSSGKDLSFLVKTSTLIDAENRQNVICFFVDTGSLQNIEKSFAGIPQGREEPAHMQGSELKKFIQQLQLEHSLFQAGPVILFSRKAEEGWPVDFVTENISQLGYIPKDFTKGDRSFIDIIYPHDRRRVLEEIEKYIAGKKNFFEQTYRITKKDGSRIWVFDYTNIIRSKEGKITGYVGYIVDMSEMKYLRSALRDREEKFRLISENLQDLIALHDPDGTYRYVSPSVRDLLGYEPEDLLGANPYDFFHPEDIERIKKEAHIPSSRGIKDMRIQYRMRKADGTYIWLETLTNPILDSDENVTQLQTASRDISLQKLMEKQVRSLVNFPEENPHPVIRASADGRIIYANRASHHLISYWNAEDSHKLPDYWSVFIASVLNEQKPREAEITIEERVYLFSITPVPEERETYIYGLDITEKLRQEKELHLTTRIFETTLEGITVTDSTGTIQSINPAFTRITGLTEEEALGKNPRILKSDRHDATFYKKMWQSLAEKGTWEGEIWNRRKTGETYPEWLSINTIYDDIGQVQNYVAVFTDISEIKRKEETIRHQAFHDPLTELPNRNLLNDRLERAITRSSRSGKKIALIFIDLDRFKIINDSLGHVTGDFLLIEVSKRLSACIREVDTISRIGGDEFVILLSEVDDIGEITHITDRIIDSFSDPVTIDGHELFVTPSMGISIYPDDGRDAAEIFKNADIAMYESKKEGGNSYRFFANRMNAGIAERLLLGSSLHRATRQKEFMIHYQPIVELKTGTIVGAEALIRWENNELGPVSPSDFIPLAEEMGLILEINDFVMESACRDNVLIKDHQTPGIYFSVNITAQQFFKGRILETINNSLASSGLEPEYITIEITENTLMENVDETIALMNEIRHIGIRFSVDDFGTGYSSLSYLRRFPLDNLKIDKSFVDELPGNEESAAIARTIIALGHSLNLKIIAEGVETVEQLNFLKNEGVDFIQGFYFSHPLPLGGFIKLLKKGPFPRKML